MCRDKNCLDAKGFCSRISAYLTRSYRSARCRGCVSSPIRARGTYIYRGGVSQARFRLGSPAAALCLRAAGAGSAQTRATNQPFSAGFIAQPAKTWPICDRWRRGRDRGDPLSPPLPPASPGRLPASRCRSQPLPLMCSHVNKLPPPAPACARLCFLYIFF